MALRIDRGHLACIESGHRLVCEYLAPRWCSFIGSDRIRWDRFSSLLGAVRALEHIARRQESPEVYLEELALVDPVLAAVFETCMPIMMLNTPDQVRESTAATHLRCWWRNYANMQKHSDTITDALEPLCA